MAPPGLSSEAMESRLREYFAACNKGDVEAMIGHFVPDAVHYFPPGIEGGPYRGAEAIAEHWATLVDKAELSWTIDSVATDPEDATGVLEWSHFAGRDGPVLRGVDWYDFDPETGLITEIRAYFASSMDEDRDRNELVGFDYDDRGYPVKPPGGGD